MNSYTLDDIHVGMRESFSRTMSEEMEDSFREITGDVNPLHRDDAFAASAMGERFHGHIAFGMLTASLYSTLAGVYLPGKYSLIHSFDELSFLKPVYVGDTLIVSGEVKDKWDALRMILVKATIRNQNGEIVSKAKIRVILQQ